MASSAQPTLLRERGDGRQRVTNMELFFDLVYVFAITQLSDFLLSACAAATVLAVASADFMLGRRPETGLPRHG